MPAVRMYAEWASLTGRLRSAQEPSSSVLHSFPAGVGREVALSTIKHVARGHSVSVPGSDMGTESSFLHSEKDLRWTMEVVCYGLTLPLNELETIKYCVHVYCDWLTSLLPNPKNCVPPPLSAAPELYCRQIINQLYNVFMPRPGESSDQVQKQAVLCHRILRSLQTVAQNSLLMNNELWEELLLLLLSVNDTLLAPPFEKDDMGVVLGERVLSVLFEVWLLGTLKNFPSPVLWKTFAEVILRWRHRVAVVDQWNRGCLSLTVRLLSDMYGAQAVQSVDIRDDGNLVPVSMSKETIKQTWYRMLHLLGNPVELTQVGVISNAPHFKHWAILQDNPKEPCEHPCLSVLPEAFGRAMGGIAAMVDAFLGNEVDTRALFGPAVELSEPLSPLDVSHNSVHEPPPSPNARFTAFLFPRRAGAMSAAITASASALGTAASSGSNHFPPARGNPGNSPGPVARGPPPCGRALVESSSFGSNVSVCSTASTDSHSGAVGHGDTRSRFSTKRPRAATFDLGVSNTTSVPAETTVQVGPSSGKQEQTSYSPPQRGSIALLPGRPKVNSILHLFGAWLFEAALVGSQFSALPSHQPRNDENSDLPDSVTADKFERGRALALGTLCRIFSAKRTHEDIQPIYLSHFYVALNQGLASKVLSSEVIASVLMNGQDLLRVDLDGVQVILPEIVAAVEAVLCSEKDPKFSSEFSSNFLASKHKGGVPVPELRRAAISILLSVLALPHHFLQLPVNRLFPFSGGRVIQGRPVHFWELRPRLLNVLTHALQYESDALNTSMLLGGLSMSVQDAALFEMAVHSSQVENSHNESGYSNASYSARTMFSKATFWVCQRLKKHWYSNLNVCLAALEALGSLAQTHLADFSISEARQPVLALCSFIVNQCSRPKQAHSRDLHSSIVAAFRCLQMWLLHYPGLLIADARGTLYPILETIELGLSGCKSVENPGDEPLMKEDKPCNPTSMRVKEAAEAVYSHIFNHVGTLQREIGVESLSTQLDEETLLSYLLMSRHHMELGNTEFSFTKSAAVKHFRYFALDNSTILALLEEPIKNEQDPQPSISVLIRGPFGRFAWTMQLRLLPRNKSGSKMLLTSSNPGRPLPANEPSSQVHQNPRYEPEDVERVPPCKVDKSIPSLESLTSSGKNSRVCAKLDTILKEQIQLEDAAFADKRGYKREYPNPETECVPPPLCSDFQTSRIFLSSFQMLAPHLGVEDPRRRSDGDQQPPLCALNADEEIFVHDLELLDRMEARTHDTLHVFYVGAGQRDLSEFLQNVEKFENTSKEFVEFLLSVGWPVTIGKHSGWTGDVATSWQGHYDSKPHLTPTRKGTVRVSGDNTSTKVSLCKTNSSAPSTWDGSKDVLYWADAGQEIAVVIPSCRSLGKVKAFQATHEAPSSRNSAGCEGGDHLASGPMQRRLNPVTKVIVAWIETQEDAATLPVGEMVNICQTGEEPSTYWQDSPDSRPVFLICIHPQQTGLYRIRLKSNAMQKISFAIPMVDGMVVSRRSLGALVRQMALNVYHRQRLEHDGFRQPHVQRTLRIQELIKKYQLKTTLPDFYYDLFTNPILAWKGIDYEYKAVNLIRDGGEQVSFLKNYFVEWW
ncbi:unnamed protein product [Notodromas monacha]|uniref:Rap-GAP domain-containing protein n=1 Tax=Notodromas monacha TaxID=399045 RepID=A0A7R9BIB7_9CRUS|nr:unnamed protein product [Notodromas monacha]CAG0914457.1 unnamed protein product [Notodromas monacha]